ncbi:MAG: MlaD family protein [Bacteroidota bacterium]
MYQITLRFLFLTFVLMILLFVGVSSDTIAVQVIAERINGLTVESAVTVNGYELGQINEISLNNQGEVVIEVRLDSEPPIPADSEFSLATTSLLGDQQISIDWGESDDFLMNGDTVFANIKPFSFQSDTLLNRFREVLDEMVVD